MGCKSAKCLMDSSAVVERQISIDPSSDFGHGVVGPEIDFLVFDRAP